MRVPLTRLLAIVLLLRSASVPVAAAPAQTYVYVTVLSCAASPCSSQLHVYDATLGTLVHRIGLPSGLPSGIALSPDGTRLYLSNSAAGSQPPSLTVIDTTRHRLIQTVPLPQAFGGPLAVRFDGSRVYIATLGILGMVDTSTWNLTSVPWVSASGGSGSTFLGGIAAHPSVDRIYIGDIRAFSTVSFGILHEFDGDGVELRSLDGPGVAPVFSSDASRLLSLSPNAGTSNGSGSVYVIDPATLTESARYGPTSGVFGPAGAVDDPRRRRLWLAVTDGALVVNRDTGQPVPNGRLSDQLLVLPSRLVISADQSRVWVLSGITDGTRVANTIGHALNVIDTEQLTIGPRQLFSLAIEVGVLAATPPTATAACSYRVNTHDVGFTVNSATASIALTTGCDWEASSDASWARLSHSQGAGSAAITLTVDPNFTTTNRSATLTIAGQLVRVSQASFSATPAFGVVDTPVDNALGINGALPVTGWALDDVGVTRVRILRDPVAGEPAGNQIFIGDATFVEGARTDVQAVFPSAPNSARAGWGLMVLTNMLPGGGNGTYRVSAYADDVEGHTTLLGTRTFMAANSTSVLPFGTIDTPGQGETVSGTIVNFGWALTPQPNFIATDGSTIDVFIDGANVGHPSYNQFRADIAALFPGYANTNGAVGYFTIDTTTYANGVHTIAWVVRDSAGHAAGIGSRYFTIANP